MLEFFVKLYRNLRYTGMLLVLLFVSWTTKGGAGEPDSRILIISSYNPETSQTAKNISDFIEEYGLLGGKNYWIRILKKVYRSSLFCWGRRHGRLIGLRIH